MIEDEDVHRRREDLGQPCGRGIRLYQHRQIECCPRLYEDVSTGLLDDDRRHTSLLQPGIVGEHIRAKRVVMAGNVVRGFLEVLKPKVLSQQSPGGEVPKCTYLDRSDRQNGPEDSAKT